MKRLILLAALICMLCLPLMAQDTTTFAWDLSTSDDGSPGGYRLYISKQSGNYVELAVVEVPQQTTTATIQNDKPGRWYAVATYFRLENGEVIESGHSNEVTYVVKPNPPEHLHEQ